MQAILLKLALEYVLPAVLTFAAKRIPWDRVVAAIEKHASVARPGDGGVKVIPVDPAGQTQPQV